MLDGFYNSKEQVCGCSDGRNQSSRTTAKSPGDADDAQSIEKATGQTNSEEIYIKYSNSDKIKDGTNHHQNID